MVIKLLLVVIEDGMGWVGWVASLIFICFSHRVFFRAKLRIGELKIFCFSNDKGNRVARGMVARYSSHFCNFSLLWYYSLHHYTKQNRKESSSNANTFSKFKHIHQAHSASTKHKIFVTKLSISHSYYSLMLRFISHTLSRQSIHTSNQSISL